MKRFLSFFIFVLITASMDPGLSAQEASVVKPNIVFILADDLGINGLHCYGNEYVESPHIDRLFSEGMHFTNGYSSDPTCAPSRASIMTGQYVPRHEIYRVVDRYKSQPATLQHMKYLPPERHREHGQVGLALDEVTLAEALKANGYRTAGFGKWHLGRKQLGMEHQGFDESLEVIGHFAFKSFPIQVDRPDSMYSSDFITQMGIASMQKAVRNDIPFFIYLPYYLVHKPLEPKPEYLQHFRDKCGDEKIFSEEDMAVLAMIKSLDDNVGQVLDAIMELGIEQETIVLFVSDNGHYKTESELFNKPYRGFKGQTYEGGIRVPYIFKWPGKIAAGSRSSEPIIHMDIYPTLLGLTGSQPVPGHVIDGEDFSPVLLGKRNAMKRDYLVWQYTNYARYNPKQQSFASKWVNVIQQDGYKMTEDVETGKYFLYDLNADPYETNEISARDPEKVLELVKSLNAWKAETGAKAPRPNPDYTGKD